MSLCPHERAAIARLTLDGALEGTAFVIAPGYALTARHLLEHTKTTTKIALVFDDRAPAETIDVTIAHPDPWANGDDWALLQLAGNTARRALPLRPWWTSNDWVSFGYGKLYVEGRALLDGGPLLGKIAADAKTLQLACEQLLGLTGDEAKGFSGAPVLCAGFVIGVISYVRADATDRVKNGPEAVPSATILEQWPMKHARPDPRVPALVTALAAALRAAGATEGNLAGKLGLTGLVTPLQLAERLAALSYNDARQKLQGLAVRDHVEVRRLIDALWIAREAGGRLYETLRSPRPVAAIHTQHELTLRHHVMRAQGHDLDSETITWADPPHLIPLDPNSNEALDELISKGAMAAYGCGEEAVPEEMRDPDHEPAIFAIPEVPTDDDVAAVEARFQRVPPLIAYTQHASRTYLEERPLTATLIEPFPDPATESRISARKKESR